MLPEATASSAAALGNQPARDTMQLTSLQMTLFQAARAHQLKQQRLRTLLAKHAQVTAAIQAVSHYRRVQQQHHTSQMREARQQTQLLLDNVLRACARADPALPSPSPSC